MVPRGGVCQPSSRCTATAGSRPTPRIRGRPWSGIRTWFRVRGMALRLRTKQLPGEVKGQSERRQEQSHCQKAPPSEPHSEQSDGDDAERERRDNCDAQVRQVLLAWPSQFGIQVTACCLKSVAARVLVPHQQLPVLGADALHAFRHVRLTGLPAPTTSRVGLCHREPPPTSVRRKPRECRPVTP